MVDLYWQFAAWAEKPFVLTNWLSVLILISVVGSLYQINKTLHEMHVAILKIANRFLDGENT
jgi:hypothetical protein